MTRKSRAEKRKEKQEKKSLQRSLNKNHPLYGHPHKKKSKFIDWFERKIQRRGK